MMDNPRKKLDLGGAWEIAFDSQDEGLRSNWTAESWPSQHSRSIQVPAIWNIEFPQADGIGFYRTTFSVPDAWRGKPVLLHFEGVIYRCEAWIDGQHVGSHEGGYTPFWFDITSYVHYGGQSELIVRVAALSKKKAIDGMLLHQAPLSKQSWHYVFGGIWGQVFLESLPAVACQNLAIYPDLGREKAQLEIMIHNRQSQCQQVGIQTKVFDPRETLVWAQEGVVAAVPGAACFEYTLHLPQPLPWSCEQPDLYRVEVQVRDENGEADHQTATFGMRDFTVRDGQFFLNNEPIFIRGILLQPNYPVTLITHPDREMMVREITLMKEAGFNLIRTHIQPSPPGYLDLTDQMGMLVYAESCLAWIRESPRLWEHGKREVQAMIERDRNHPSVVFWGIYNENPTSSAVNGEALARWARAIDPTRVVIDDSGGSLAIDQDFGWIDRATAIPAFQSQPERILDVHLYLGAPISRAMSDWLRTLGSAADSQVLVQEGIGTTPVMEEFDRECRSYRGKVFVSELGYGGMSDLEETVAGFDGREDLLDASELKTFRDSLQEGFSKRNLSAIFGSQKNLSLEAQEVHALGNTQQVSALLCNPRISGYVITQLNDVSWEFHAGILDLWRNPKLAYYAAQKLNQPHLLILNPQQVNAYLQNTIKVDVFLVNRVSIPAKGRLHITVTDPQGQAVLSTVRELTLLQGAQSPDHILVEMKLPGSYQVAARLEADQKVLVEASETLQAFDLQAFSPIDWNEFSFKIREVGQPAGSKRLNAILQPETTHPDSDSDPEHLVYLAAHPGTLSEEQWDTLFRSVQAGAGAVIGALRPEDQLAIQEFNRRGFKLEVHPGIGSWMGCNHWIPEKGIFTGLPAGGLAKRPYAEFIPKYVLSELGGEVLAGSLRNTQSRQQPPSMLWYSDIEVVRFGKGAILLCQYRIFDCLEWEPLAAQLAKNIFKLVSEILEGELA